MIDDAYNEIRVKMNKGWPLKLPKHDKIIEFLKILFPSEEELKILSVFDAILFDLKSIKKISKLTGYSIEKVEEICNKMAKRGVIMKSGKKYAMFPIMPGIFEFYFVSRADPPEVLKRAAEVFHDIIDTGLLNEWYTSKYPFFRTLPSSSLQEKVKSIDINEEVGVQHEILIYEDVEKYIKRATSVRVINCACRTTASYLGDHCEKPMDICMALNFASDSLEQYDLGKSVSRDEAFELLKTAEKHGLVHTIINASGPDAPMLICNCCSCHCGVLRGITEFDNPSAFAKSNYRPEINQELCINCEKCMKICPMSAIWHHFPHDKDDEFMLIKEGLCIGCGLCAHHCPKDAISMIKKYDDVPEESILGVFQKIEETRGH
ncbi:MAG: hypothetical protein EAX96_00420 [Candidatus Lokiarchaeota archaeon]|nr:hypothetical protein [Candidatus Lokiarchaeota archaeon]